MFEIGNFSVVDAEDMSPVATGITNGMVYIDILEGPLRIETFVSLIPFFADPRPIQEVIAFIKNDNLEKMVVEAITEIMRNHADDGSLSMAVISLGINDGLAVTRSEPGKNLRFAGEPGFRKVDGSLLTGDPTLGEQSERCDRGERLASLRLLA